MILDKLAELQPVEVREAAAAVMPLIPFAYIARQGSGSAFRAAKAKIHSLKQRGHVSNPDGVITVNAALEPAKTQRASQQAGPKHSRVRQCVDQLNATGKCDMSAIWSSQATLRTYKSVMRGLGWISPDDKGSVVTFIGDHPATVKEFNDFKYKYRQRK